jgi:ornithine decarboxylase
MTEHWVPLSLTTYPPSEIAHAGAIFRMRAFLDQQTPRTPCLVIDLPTVRDRYLDLVQALPGARLFYAIKANPAPEVVRLLKDLGACFDAASLSEIELCLAEGVRPEDISYGNTIKKRADVAAAYALGVRKFTSDSLADLENLAVAAPGSSVFCRIMLVGSGAMIPLGQKFGCAPEVAICLLRSAVDLGLRAAGVSFHVGSQQTDPAAWDEGIAEAASISSKLADYGIDLPLLNIGGGLPGPYVPALPPLADYLTSICRSVVHHFDTAELPLPGLILEPGRFLVADSGLLRAEVVLVTRKSAMDDHRWVYLDCGCYNGMAESGVITYPLSTPDRDGETGPVILAGPTCDGDDVMYECGRYCLPLELQAGDFIDFLNSGAYTASFASVGFNGFTPLSTHCI